MIKLYIKEWCKAQATPITARQLAEKTNIPEVSLNRIINGNAWPERERLEKIAQALGISANDLFADPATKGAVSADGVTCPQCGYRISLDAK